MKIERVKTSRGWIAIDSDAGESITKVCSTPSELEEVIRMICISRLLQYCERQVA